MVVLQKKSHRKLKRNITQNRLNHKPSKRDIELSNELITIDDMAFRYCVSLNSITFPKNVKEIGSESFYDCRNLISIICYGIVAPKFAPDAFDGTPYGKGTLYYPKGSDYSKWLKLFRDWKHQEIDI